MSRNLIAAKEKLEYFLQCAKCSIISRGCYYGPCQHIYCKNCINQLRHQCKLCKTPVEKFETNDRIDEIISQLDNLKELLAEGTEKEEKITTDVSSDDDLPPADFFISNYNKKANEPSTSGQSKKSNIVPRNLEKRNYKGETPLHVATNSGDFERIQTLLKNGANVNTKDNAGWMPLHEATLKGFKNIIALLLDNGANVNESGMNKVTALHDAVIRDDVDIAELLLNRGADIYAKNNDGKMPIDLAISTQMKQLLQTSAIKNITKIPTVRVEKIALRSSRIIVPKKLVFVTTGLTYDQRDDVKECAEILNADVLTDVDEKTTHLIAKSINGNNCPRTLKYMHAVARGTWIVKFDWLLECKKAGHYVSEKPYEFGGCGIHPNNDVPRLAREHREMNLQSLFYGCSIYFFGDFYDPNKADMVSLAESCGAKILTRVPTLSSVEESDNLTNFKSFEGKVDEELEKCSHYILFQRTLPAVKHKDAKLRTLHAKFLLNSISKFELKLENAI